MATVDVRSDRHMLSTSLGSSGHLLSRGGHVTTDHVIVVQAYLNQVER